VRGHCPGCDILLIFRVDGMVGATYIKLGMRDRNAFQWRSQCPFQFLDTLLYFETTILQMPNFALL